MDIKNMNNKNKNWFWPGISIILFIILSTLIISPWPMLWSHNTMNNLDMHKYSNMDIIAQDTYANQSKPWVYENLINEEK